MAAATALVKVTMTAESDVADLTKALVAELQLGVSSDRIVLTVVDEGGATIKVLTDPKATLDSSGVTSGATVVVSVLPPPASASVEAGAFSPSVHPWSSGAHVLASCGASACVLALRAGSDSHSMRPTRCAARYPYTYHPPQALRRT